MAAKLIKCDCCGKDVASDCKKCIHCGAKIKKKSKGCAVILVLLLIVIFVAMVMPKREIQYDNTPSTSQQTHVYKEEVAHSFAVTHLQKVSKTPVKTTGKYTVQKLPPAAALGDVVKGDTYAFEQDFIQTNEFGVDVKHRYRAVVEFYAPRGYRVIWFMVDGVKI